MMVTCPVCHQRARIIYRTRSERDVFIHCYKTAHVALKAKGDRNDEPPRPKRYTVFMVDHSRVES